MSMAYYLQTCGRSDMEVVPLYDPHYVPQDGDFIILEPSRRFLETQKFFDVLGSSGMLHSEVRVGPVIASTIYLFDSSAQGTGSHEGDSTLAQFHGSPPRFEYPCSGIGIRKSRQAIDFSHFTRRLIQ